MCVLDVDERWSVMMYTPVLMAYMALMVRGNSLSSIPWLFWGNISVFFFFSFCLLCKSVCNDEGVLRDA